MRLRYCSYTLLVGLLIVVSGCSGVREAQRLTPKNEAACAAPVVGTFTTREQWSLRTPAIVLASDIDRPIYGDSLAVVGDSVYFDASRVSPFVNPEPRWYSRSELAVAISPSGEAVVGHVPGAFGEAWSSRWYIRPAGSEAEAAWMRVEDAFAYCLDAGTHEVVRLALSNREGYLIESYPGPWFSFDVEEEWTNHLGTWVLDDTGAADSTSIIVLARITSRPATGLGMFGLVGALAELAIHSAQNNEVRPVLHVSMEGEGAVPVWARPVRASTVTKLGPDLLPPSRR